MKSYKYLNSNVLESYLIFFLFNTSSRLFVCVMLFFTIDLGRNERDQKGSEAGNYV